MADKTITLDDVARNASRTDVKPRISILDRRFVWVPSEATDVRKTWARFLAKKKDAE